MRLNIYMWKTKFFLINSIYFVFSCLEMKISLIQTKAYYRTFYSVWRETSHKPLKAPATIKSFSSVYRIDTTCFNEWFLFHVTTGRHYFLHKFLVALKFVKSPCSSVLWNKCFEGSPHFISVISIILQCC